jgi:hypothetical protein
MDASAVTSITNFILAGEVFFFAGMMAQISKARFSAAWFWSGMMLFLGLATLIGGIDHGFFEGPGLPRAFIQRLTWILLGMMTFFLLMTVASQFFSRQVRRFFLIFGIVQFIAYTIAILAITSFLVVIVNYAPVMLFLLVMCLLHVKKSPGLRSLIFGILILFAASAVQRSNVLYFGVLDQNGVYHLISMVGMVWMVLGGKDFRKTVV